MNKPQFDPSQPSAAAKPAFDPSQPSAAAKPAFDPSQPYASKSSTPIKDAALGAMHTLGVASAIAGGSVRNAIAQGVDLKDQLRAKLEGREPENFLTREGDTMRALKGNAPKTAEYLDRAGVPEGYKVSDAIPMLKNKYFDPSMRDVAGFAGDVATDPLTYLSGGLSAAAKGGEVASSLKALLLANEQGLTGAGKVANAVINPIEALSRKSGRSFYDSGFDRADRALETEEGKAAISDYLRKNRFTGSADDALELVKNNHDQLGSEIGAIRQKSTAAGGMGDVGKDISDAELSRMQNTYKPLNKSPELAHQEEAGSLKNLINDYMNQGPKSTENLAAIKLAAKPSKATYYKMMQNPSQNREDDLRALLAGALNKSENSSVENALGKEAADAYRQTKKDYGLTGAFTEKKLAQQAQKESNYTGAGISGVDLLAAQGNPLSLALKKIKDVSRLTGTKTTVGLGLEDFGNAANGLADEAARKLFWEKVLKEKEQRQ